MECAYHGDDGDFFCSGSGKPYGPTFTVGDTIGCYLNFRNDDKMIFYIKNVGWRGPCRGSPSTFRPSMVERQSKPNLF
ncbi:hypothetical protein C2G38_2177492 [Gigaspora rosea]|uniref:SPRY domain-containing protein n=1 Tax=Gigaspora rosea TaxID=44941 RepID=A0A397VF98_9GLOM|nr:hypothetical protein C2G38_2177492 [Gigaspora rosea]